MPLVNMKDLLAHAYGNGYAVGAFNLVSLDFLEAIITAAERARAPVILSLAEPHCGHFDFELAMPAVEAAARRCSVPVAIHLDHGANLESVVRAIRLGVNSVMVDTSLMPLDKKLTTTRAVVALAQACGVAVEGELGYSTAVESRYYMEKTGVDCLAVSFDTVREPMKNKPRLDLPLVIHGDTDLSDNHFRKLISLGVAKINYYTTLADVADKIIRANARSGEKGYTELTARVRAAIVGEVERCMRVGGSADRAAEVLACCQPWLNVEHVVVYNTPTLDEDKLRTVMAEGQRTLAAIPGVREVQVGSVADKSARYRHCWLIRFASTAVIDSYKQHPAHVAFADRLFRPAAADRLTADYCVVDTHTGVAALPLSAHDFPPPHN